MGGLSTRFNSNLSDRHINDSTLLLKDEVGTIYYVAPEVLKGKYLEKCDVWSIGVTAYVLLCGFAPFNAGSEKETYHLVEAGIVNYPSPAWDRISKEGIDFVQTLLTVDVQHRPSAAEALKHPWLNHENILRKGMTKVANLFFHLTTTTSSERNDDDDNEKTGGDHNDQSNGNVDTSNNNTNNMTTKKGSGEENTT